MAQQFERDNAKRRREWEFRATIYHDVDLEPRTWAVDGEVQDVDLTEENLLEAIAARSPAKPLVTVGPPLHLFIARITGFQPPYRHVMEELSDGAKA